MSLLKLKFVKKATKKRKRVGRGNSAGQGGECGRGHKGQRSRSGFKNRFGFEGGQTPLYRRIPKKRGFNNKFKVYYVPINISYLNDNFIEGELVDLDILVKKSKLKNNELFKILGQGDLKVKLNIKANAVSKLALKKIQESGSTLEILS